jgi:uncharacterized protein (TIGR03435 family)
MQIHGDRFDFENASMLDLISLAYGKHPQTIVGGPSWLEFNRYDIAARMPPGTTYATAPPLLQALLVERFHLATHTEDRPLPGMILTVAKGGSKLTKAPDQSDESPQRYCSFKGESASPTQYVQTITCAGTTVTQFAESIQGFTGRPAVDSTGLKGIYNITLKMTMDGTSTREELMRQFGEQLEKQLGLRVEMGTASQPALVVDKADAVPTPNLPDIAKLLPPTPVVEFDVATVKKSAEDERQNQRRSRTQVDFIAYTMQDLMVEAWQLPTGVMLSGLSDSIRKARFTISARYPADVAEKGITNDILDAMLQKLLVDRFQIKWHWGEETQQAWTLYAATPRMKKSDPNSRTGCKYGYPEGGKNQETPETGFDHQFYCLNITMAQFADVMQYLTSSDVKQRVADRTGLTGSYDFTVAYSSARKMRANRTAVPDEAKQPGDLGAAAPPPGMGLAEAFQHQLGLRLVQEPRAVPVVVLEHMEETPTEN